jgi:hypothetical protein
MACADAAMAKVKAATAIHLIICFLHFLSLGLVKPAMAVVVPVM